MTDSLAEQIAADLTQLRTALAQQDDLLIDRNTMALQQDLLDGQRYVDLGDERLLAAADHMLRLVMDTQLYSRLDGLAAHLSAVRAIHAKLFAILNAAMSLDDVLQLHLSQWPQLTQPIGGTFPADVKDDLHSVRGRGSSEEKLQSFFEIYFGYLQSAGYSDVVVAVRPLVIRAIDAYRRLHRWTVQALFVVQNQGEVHGVLIQPHAQGTDKITCMNEIDTDMEHAARAALNCVRKLWASTRNWDFIWEIDRYDISFSGQSIGLALTIGLLARAEGLDIDAYTAFTGHVIWDSGKVVRIEGLKPKLDAARKVGIRRVFIPRQNMDEIKEGMGGLEIVPIDTIGEVVEWVRHQTYKHNNTQMEAFASAYISKLDIELRTQGIERTNLIQREMAHKQAVYTDRRTVATVEIYYAQKLSVIPPRQNTDLAVIIRDVIGQFSASLPSTAAPATSMANSSGRETYKVTDREMQRKIEKYFFERDDTVREVEQNCLYRAKIVQPGQTVFVRQFSTGTLTVGGNLPLFTDINQVIKNILGLGDRQPSKIVVKERTQEQIDAVTTVELGEQWIGTDESGKGDYYGPLVAAAVLVDAALALRLSEIGVRDSKTMNDNQNRGLATKIRELCGKRAQVVSLSPEAYNKLYLQMKREGKNLNSLLAWAHSRALENVLSVYPQDQIAVIIDKFADEHYIQDRLMTQALKTKLRLIQLPKAEANIAVAAASILARARFLDDLTLLEREYGVTLPKGASDKTIVPIAQAIVARHGQSGLARVAKLHFKTTQAVLGNREEV